MNARTWLLSVCAATLFVAGQPAGAEDISEKLDIYFVPTPEPVVDEMLRLAEVREGDTLFDLGCGDGRIVVTAASRFGVQAVGVDLDPERIRESVGNAKAAGVEDRVRFIEGNLFDADLSSASVVTLYLLTSINERLRPKLLRELRPGARIVSHSFDMGPWRPDKQSRADGAKVYLWVVPASVEGRWVAEMHQPDGDAPFSMSLEQAFQDVTGLAVIDGNHLAIERAQLTGDSLELLVAKGDGAGDELRLTGKVAGGTIEGWVYAGGSKGPIGRWSAARVPSASEGMLTSAQAVR